MDATATPPVLTPEQVAHALCRALEEDMRRLGVVTTAHYERGVSIFAESLRAAVLAEREACARLAEERHRECGHTECHCWHGDHIALLIRGRAAL